MSLLQMHIVVSIPVKQVNQRLIITCLLTLLFLSCLFQTERLLRPPTLASSPTCCSIYIEKEKKKKKERINAALQLGSMVQKDCLDPQQTHTHRLTHFGKQACHHLCMS